MSHEEATPLASTTVATLHAFPRTAKEEERLVPCRALVFLRGTCMVQEYKTNSMDHSNNKLCCSCSNQGVQL